MAVEDRSSSHLLKARNLAALESALERAPWSMCFFNAVRRLETLRRDLPRVGDAPSVDRDAVVFGQDPFFAFPARDIDSFTPGGGTRPGRMNLFCFGLLGPLGPMPGHLTDELRRRVREEDEAGVAFLNMLTTRMASLFYKAWVKSDQAVSFDRLDASHAAQPIDALRDVFLRSILRLGGCPLSDRSPGSVPLLARAFFAGRMTASVRNPEGLASIVADFFGIPASVDEFQGRWVDLPPPMHCRLGRDPNTARLGHSAVVGARVWETVGAFRLVLGPMSFDDYVRLMPCGDSARLLRDWIVSYAGPEHEAEVQLVLAADQVPVLGLGRSSRLGWSCWLRSRPMSRDRGDLVYPLPALERPSSRAD
jgi:type VI secretion system protein ImpH